MEWVRTIADLIRAVVWPALVVGVILLYRHELGGLLNRIQSVRAAGVEVAFNREAHDLEASLTEAEVAAVLAPSEEPVSATTDETEERQEPVGLMGVTLGGLINLAREAPRAAVIRAWSLVEDCARQAATVHGLPSDRPSYVAHALYASRVMAADYTEAARRLEQMRNGVTHVEIDVGTEAAQTYSSSAFRFALALIQAANESPTEPKAS
jgi:hypothetical protein